MRIETIKRELYKFEELTEEAQQTVYNNFFSFNLQDWQVLVDEYFQKYAKEEGEKIGIAFNTVYYSLEGENYLYLDKPHFKDFAKFFKYSNCTDTKAMLLLKEATDIFIKQSRYNNFIDCSRMYLNSEKTESRLESVISSYLEPSLIQFLSELRYYLNKEYDYITSESYISDQIGANDYEFTIEGNLA